MVGAYLGDAQSAPFLLPEKLQSIVSRVEVVFWDDLEHWFWKLHMSILILVVGISLQTILSTFLRVKDSTRAYLAE